MGLMKRTADGARAPRVEAALLALALVVSSTVVHADGPRSSPMLHEYVAPDAKEDVDLETTNPGGQLPAAVKTQSGTIVPPDIRTTPEPQHVYQGESSGQTTFRPDRDTRRPQVENYDEPFTPTLTPFKRMFAYDAVRDDYNLYVREPEPLQQTIGGEVKDADDRFFGDMVVQLRAGDHVRIPTVGAGARMVKIVTSPKTAVTLWRDGADNWFLHSESSERVRVVSEIAIERDSFASEFRDVPWSSLPRVPPQPTSHQEAFRRVSQKIGISRTMSPREVVHKLVAYFRSFAPSNDPPNAEGDIYLDLALSQKGVCRHRAFAFLVTALNIGIPTRLVHNEAHAWIEVRDDKLWHRIDLGGAAMDLEEDPHLERPTHEPPPDQFPWPTGRDSGAELARREREQAAERRESGGGQDPGGTGDPGSDPGQGPGNQAVPTPRPDLPETALTVDTIDADIFRGLPLRIRGTARADGQPCGNMRVDVTLLIDGETAERRLGSLSTDARGFYDGAVIVPRDVPVGDHQLTVTTHGSGRCGSGQVR
jgi:hypothetical protein